MTEAAFESWAVLELMGHRQRPGFVREVEIAGGKMLRVDIPGDDGDVTEFYGIASVYSIRPVSEEIARDLAKRVNIQPVRPAQYAAIAAPSRDYDDEDELPL
jgi:hypothetical protein